MELLATDSQKKKNKDSFYTLVRSKMYTMKSNNIRHLDKKTQNTRLFDWIYIFNLLMGLLAVKEHGRILEFFVTIDAIGRASIMLCVAAIAIGAMLFWKRCEPPTLAVALGVIFITESEALSLFYVIATVCLGAGWFLIWRKKYKQKIGAET